MSVLVEKAYFFPTSLRHEYAMKRPSGLHEICSSPPNGSVGSSYSSDSPARMSTEFSGVIDFSAPSKLKSAMKVCGISRTVWSQCLYIRSSLTYAVALSRSACLSTGLSTWLFT